MPPYDVKRERNDLYAPKNTTWAMVDVPPQRFLAVDGQGDPNTAPAYASAVAALYAVGYTVKFAARRQLDRDMVVAPLEGLWWSDDYAAFTARAKGCWRWTMLISQPDWVPDDLIEQAGRDALARKALPAISDVRLLALREGQCLQMLHVGSYDDEAPALAALHQQLTETGLTWAGKHHEIYLSDPRRTQPARLKTIIRQPVV